MYDHASAFLDYSDQKLTSYAALVAKENPKGKLKSARNDAKKIKKALISIGKTYKRTISFIEKESLIPQEMEWITDNFYIAQSMGDDAMQSLRSFKHIPTLAGNHKNIYVGFLAESFLQSTGYVVDEDKIASFLQGVSEESELLEEEMSAFLSFLKAGIVYLISEVCGDIELVLDGYTNKNMHNCFSGEMELWKIRDSGTPPTESQIASKKQAYKTHEQLSDYLRRAFTSLRFIIDYDFNTLIKEQNPVEQILSEDPSGDYPNMSEKSRAYYRYRLSKLAKEEKISGKASAQRVIAMAKEGKSERERHVGYYILEKPFGHEKEKMRGRLYIASIITLCILIAALFSYFARNFPAFFLFLAPAFEIAKSISDYFVIRIIPPAHLPRLELKNGIPESGKTLCIITALVTSEKAAKHFAGLLNEYLISNRDAGKNVGYGILLDLKDSKKQTEDTDDLIIEAARDALSELDSDGKDLFLFVRRRTLNKQDNVYMGYERKRGALYELTEKIVGKKSGVFVMFGNEEKLKTYKLLVTLDSDTRPEPESIRALAGTALHPLNRPEIDPETLTVKRGHGILQPGILPSLEAANRSFFSRIFAGVGGVDPYGSAISDVYQDLFSEGIYTGKGLIDIDAFDRVFYERLPENQILSHDLIEGIYLRAGFVSDVQFTDGFPFKLSSYFTRMHRWIRGDFQISPWLLEKVYNQKGEIVQNPINKQGKWKIFDNLRRSLTPFVIFLILVLGSLLSYRFFIPCILISMISIMMPLLTDLAVILFRGDGMRKYHSNILTGVPANSLRTLLNLSFLPYQAIIGLGAAITALYRMIVSKKNLLLWVTADQADQRNVSAVRYHRLMLPSVIAGLFVILAGHEMISVLLGLVWIFSPQVGYLISREAVHHKKISDEDNAFLKREAAFIWKYFEDFLRPEDHYLPPDNYQEQPPVGLARRTSPTNIGLCILCIISAKDLGFIDEARAVFLIGKMLTTIEKLEKWEGHLLNWYDTKKARPLYPRCVSSVDSGNFLACLIVAYEALSEFESDKREELKDRVYKIASAIDLRPLYDKKRKLFYISRDVETGRTSSGVYDLMSSESRILSYVAVALGQAPKKHWERLGRGLTQLNGYRGMLSWTGTMFEYLMPNLLIPAYENSMLYESMQFAVYVQKLNGKKRGTPFGISESAFYAFDNALNYQYKAHGVQRLGLKRGLDREQVVSPYSSFLALSIDHENAIRNLRRLRDMGMEGRYGFFEACDFTVSRLPGQKEYAIVRCYMAHHIGMSLIAISNLISKTPMTERFMRDARMRAYQGLLCEKIPVGTPVIRVFSKDVPDKPKPALSEVVREFSDKEYGAPVINLLSNGSYRLLITDDGRSRSESGRVQLTSFSTSDPSVFSGIGFFLKTEEQLTSLLKMPFYEGNAIYSGRFEASRANHICKTERFTTCIRSSVLESMDAEIRQVELKNTSGNNISAQLLVYFEPQIENASDFSSHPAFSKLFLKTEILGNAVIIKRRPRDGGDERGIVFCCDSPVKFDTSKEAALGRGGVRRIYEASKREAMETDGAVIDPCILARVNINLKAGETKNVTFALAAGRDLHETLSRLERALIKKTPDLASRQEGCARVLGLTKKDVGEAFDLYSSVLFGKSAFHKEAALHSRLGQQDLWCFGISGELPIAAIMASDEEAAKKAAFWIKKHIFCFVNGALFDLILFTFDGGEYHCPVRTALMEALKSSGGESLLGIRGGVHFIDILKTSEEERDFLYSCASIIIDPEKGLPKKQIANAGLFRMRYVSKPDGGVAEGRFLEDGSYQIQCDRSLPSLVQSHILANMAFGYIASDCGAGHMWFQNSRENRINCWINDPLAVSGPEQVEFFVKGEKISVFADHSGTCTVTFAPGYAQYEKKVGRLNLKTTIFVCKRLPCRIVIAEVTGECDAEDLMLSCGTTLQLGPTLPSTSHIVSGVFEETGAVWVQNRYNTEFSPYYFTVIGSGKNEYTCSLPSFQGGNFDGAVGAGLDPCLALRTTFVKNGDKHTAVIVHMACGKLNVTDGAKILAGYENAMKEFNSVLEYWKSLAGKIQIHTKDGALDRYMNTWAVYQTLCCRVYARTSFYQNGGAFGFRDQLQDVTALTLVCPDVVKEHIIRACAHQFLEGDTQHWWHYTNTKKEEGHRGIRTKCSDDLLWLPYALCEYLEKTEDFDILKLTVPYIESPPLDENSTERYETPRISPIKETIFYHAVRAVDLVLKRGSGEHSLPLIGTCDWNDGMNMVGVQGKGESVWLSWFLSLVLSKMAKLCEAIKEDDRAARYLKKATEYAAAAEAAWDDSYFLRGYYDDGEPLGSKVCDECKIDSISQSFSTLVPCDENKSRTAVKSAVNELFDRENQIILLLKPPFENSVKNPGYIKGYLPGVRENGGQYTHGAIWLAMGCFLLSYSNDGYDILKAILPENHLPEQYKAEPFVIAADVYANPQHIGRGGWSYYTGASGWFFRVTIENMLGIKVLDGKLIIKPSLPDDFNGYKATLHYKNAVYQIEVLRNNKLLDAQTEPEEKSYEITLKESGEHKIVLEL
ncbi:MAG: hypothetical protein N2Z65_03325 [Clostridiales bacterium]|nr:hypothetical protein [Clostridiales bacterium]